MIASAAQHRKQGTELVKLMAAAIASEVVIEPVSAKKLRLHRPERPGIPGYPLPHIYKGALVRRRYTHA